MLTTMSTRASAVEERYARTVDFESRTAEQERFGKNVEPAFGKFLAYAAEDVIQDVRRGTETEDHEMIDYVVTLKNGKHIAL